MNTFLYYFFNALLLYCIFSGNPFAQLGNFLERRRQHKLELEKAKYEHDMALLKAADEVIMKDV